MRITPSAAAGVELTLPSGAVLRFYALLKARVFAVGVMHTDDTPVPVQDPDREHCRPGDLVLSRDEHDAGAPVEPKVVEEVFERYGHLMHLTLAGRRIGTTAEHPFWVVGHGWLQAGDIGVGDELLGHDGQVVRVDAKEPGEWATVYNLQIADWHTYFVGCMEWGFSAWAHNEYDKLSAMRVTEMLVERGIEGHFAKSIARKIGEYGGLGDSDTLARQVIQDIVEAGGDRMSVQQKLKSYVEDAVESPASQAGREAFEAKLKGESWRSVIEDKHGTDALGREHPGEYMTRSNGEEATHITHGHHVAFKEGLGKQGKILAEESRDLLRYYDIDPIYGKENLVYAPNQGHLEAVIAHVHKRLFEIHEAVGTRQGIVDELKVLGQQYIDRDIPGWSTK